MMLVQVPGAPGVFDEVEDRPGATVHALHTDAQLAVEFKARGRVILEQFAALMNEARDRGLIISMAISPNQFGKYFVQDVSVVRPL